MKKTLAVLVAAVLVITALCACLTVSAEATNVAAGKSYKISQQFRQSTETWGWADDADIAYPDDGKKLTDGKFAAEDVDFHDAAWMGFHGGAPEYKDTLGYSYIRIDLGAVCDLSELKIYVGTSKLGSGISIPTSVQFFVSDDGETFTQVSDELAPVDSNDNVYTAVSQTVSTSARYVEARLKREGNWMFVTEFEAYGEPADGGNAGTGTSTPSESKPAESKPADSGKPATGDTGIVVFAVLGIAAVAGAVVATKKRAR